MAPGADKVVGIGCIFFSMLVIVAMSITILSVNRQQLFNVTAWCYSYPTVVACIGYSEQCWAAQSPFSDMVPCNYLYALGAVGLMFQLFIACLPCLDSMIAMGCMAVFGLLNFGWWLAGGIWFTQEFKDINDAIPAKDWRDVILGVTWTAFGMSVVQLLAMGAAAWTARKANKQEEAEFHNKPNQQEMGAVPAPPQPAYGGYPASGYPAAAPPAPAP